MPVVPASAPESFGARQPEASRAMIDESAPFPRVLILCIAVTGGVMTAVVAQLALARFGLDLGAAWRALLGARTGQLRSAFAWWAIALASFASGFLIAAVAGWIGRTESRIAPLCWIGGLALVAGLAPVGHAAVQPSGLGPGANAALGIAVLTVAGLLSLLGAYFATRR
ncbi:hypothetical protein [Rhodoplanes roseus]|uniref:Uncharacterized protein n=1 Tax=Rhodoplanes roseus TaxID=29409 RepID=A0A327KAU7_9BRAD|nr:hypothetical protein [Rhodoplanes roseus]RAI35909.1 hypothetical protein CH341_30655 [Rhodoplanes roseus]